MPPVRKATRRRKATTPKPSCFVISPIGKEGSPERRSADQVFRHVIVPAVKKMNYDKPIRADQISSPGLITHQVIQAVADADLVIADLTDHNPNVFYELAIRHGLQRPLVQLVTGSEDLPFDIANMRTIKFDIHDLDSAARAREQLVEQLADLQASDTPTLTPISVARDIKQLWESENPTSHMLADVLANLSSLKAEVQTQRQAPSTLFPGLTSAVRPGEERIPGIGSGVIGSMPTSMIIGAGVPAMTTGVLDPPISIYGGDPALGEEGPPRKPSPEGTKRRTARAQARKRKPRAK